MSRLGAAFMFCYATYMEWLLSRSWMPKINQVILIIVIAEFILTTAAGLLPPFFAVYVTQQIIGGTIAVVGFALTIYWLTKSSLQLFIARSIDKNHGEIDDFYFFLAGGLMNAICISLYYFATHVWHIYLIHFVIGIADAMLVPPFYAIFTRHIDKGEEGFEWALYSSFSLGAGSALGGAIGGILASVVGFRAMFLVVGLLVFIFSIILLFLRPYIRPKVPTGVIRIPAEKGKI